MPNQTRNLTVLVVGSGGREHALARACSQSPLVSKTLAAPGNPGIEQDGGACHAVPVDQIEALVALAIDESVDFVVVGPEVPLCLGLVDALSERGILAFGPTKNGAKLEGSKIFTKTLLAKHNIPTGAAASFDEVEAAIEYLETASFPIVIKADGLAAGKGVIIAENHQEAIKAVKTMILEGVFGESGRSVLIEECLFGEETSIHVIVSGQNYVMLPTSQDHKQAYEGDRGPNTGGMGAYSPAELIDDRLLEQIEQQIVRPSVDAIAAEGIDFRGTLFIGLMITATGPKVLEYNTRFGDPETQVLLPRLKTDPVALMLAAAKGELESIEMEVSRDYAVAVVLAAKGYPGSYPKDDVIELPNSTSEKEIIFQAGTKRDSAGNLVTNGGRVLAVTALASSLQEATRNAYQLCDRIHFDSKYLRRDIGAKQLVRRG